MIKIQCQFNPWLLIVYNKKFRLKLETNYKAIRNKEIKNIYLKLG